MKRTNRVAAAALAGAVLALASTSPANADPVRDAQWHLTTLRVPESHTFSRGEGVIVGLIDTGVDADHPDLAGNIMPGRDFTTEGGDGREDLDGHGTLMAGLMVADGRALGIAPGAKVMSVREKLYDDIPGASDLAIEWAIDNGADVLCLAYVETDSAQSRSAIARAIANDIVVVAGVGNEPALPGYLFPAGYPGVVGVAGVDRAGNHAKISVVSPFAVLAAPAVDVVSPDSRRVGSGYSTVQGTSASTAIVAGAAALVRSKFPELSAAEVVHRLTATADDKGAPGRDDQFGYGVVNLVKALTADVSPLSPSPTATNVIAAPPSGPPSARMITVIGMIVLLVLICAAFVAASFLRRRP